MTRFRTLLILTLLADSALSVAAAGDPDPGFSLGAQGVQIHVGKPAVVLADGNQTETLQPVGRVEVSEEVRQTPAGPGQAKIFRWKDASGHATTWTLTQLPDGSGATVQMTFTNGSTKPVRLREFLLSRSGTSPSVQVDGNPADWWLSTLDSHNFPQGGFLPSQSLAANGSPKYCDVLSLYTDHGRRGLFMGAIGPAESDVFFRGSVADGKLGVEIVSDMTDVVVDPGETRRSEEVLITTKPYAAAVDQWTKWVASTHGSRTARGPVFGWCSWYDVTTKVTAAQILDVAKTVSELRDRIPMQVIQIDDGWQKAYGDWTADKVKFPDGMKPVADAIRAAGAIPGIWMCMVRTSAQGAHPDGSTSPEDSKKPEYIDATHPEVKKFIRENLAARVAEGFRYFKLDFNGVRTENRYDQKKTRLQIHRDLFQLYRESIGGDSYLLACVGGTTRGPIGFADAQRIGTDSVAKWGKLDLGCCILDCIHATGTAAPTNGVLFAADPDVSYSLPRGTLTADELRTWHSFVGLFGGLMLVSEPIQTEKYRSPESLRMLEILNPPAPDKARSFSAAVDPFHKQFGFVAKRPWGNFASVLLWNPGDAPADVSLEGIPLEPLGEKFHIWSFWDRKYLGTGDKDSAAKALPPHAPALLRLTPVSDAPTLVGSDLHISMGSAEIQDVRSGNGTVTVTLTDAGARDGNLVFFSRRPLKLAAATGCKAELSSAGENLWNVALASRKREEPNVITVESAQ